jgi:hypothetical protein
MHQVVLQLSSKLNHTADMLHEQTDSAFEPHTFTSPSPLTPLYDTYVIRLSLVSLRMVPNVFLMSSRSFFIMLLLAREDELVSASRLCVRGKMVRSMQRRKAFTM